MPTTVKQWNNGVITARQHVQNGGVTYRQSQGDICKTAHFIGVRQLTEKAERHLGTLKRDATYVKSVKCERHFHSLQQYFISTSQPPFSGIITVVSACRDWHDVTAKRCGAKVETQNLASHKQRMLIKQAVYCTHTLRLPSRETQNLASLLGGRHSAGIEGMCLRKRKQGK
ncbi:MAG: hypothetical protein BHV84_07835 [Prevotella sp. AG:487_50_53]|nr:MAG: hypothetical protein BHV84_07835 [Prevotella sp. AG:487_50_53]